jgi:AmmeMemoRadiSam system protein B/AmmeMemoRadiSam system protein A
MKTKILISILVLILIIAVILQIFVFSKREKREGEEKRGPAKKEKIIREPAVAGQFYPSEKSEIETQIEKFFENAKIGSISGKIFALILPHAGYQFSGQVASFGYKALLENYKENLEKEKTIVLIGSSHHYPIEGAVIDGSDTWKTPLGEIEIDKDLVEFLKKESPIFKINSTPHKPEHSLEVHLPFLQKIFPKFKIVPILVNQLREGELEKVSQILAEISGDNIIFIASSDMSHYPKYEDANYADKRVIEAILSGKVENLEKTIQDLEKENIQNAVTFLCAKEPVKIVMKIAEKMGADKIELLKYANSGDTSYGNKSSVVGYSAIAFLLEGKPLSTEDQKTLLKIARETVETYIREGKFPEYKIDSPALNKKLGAFVTIKKHGNLRGCIGRFSPTDIPLYQVVSQMAIAAATQDVRFTPVRVDELKDLTYEISVLSPLKRIDDWRKIEIGKHGVQIRYGLRSGVFLPQVATENNWNLETFLSMLCIEKLGLPGNCYKEKEAQIYVFTAQVFGEE